MRHTVLCLIVAFLAAVACFVLLPMIGLLLLRIFTPGVFDDDSLVWISIFVGPPLLALLVGFSFLTGLVAFLISMARLPDRGWRSAQTSAILLTFAATIATAGAIAWPYYAEPPEAGPLQTGLPSLHLARTLKAAGNRSGTWRLSWSADSERLAAYSGAGIVTWSPDGKYQREIPVYRNSVTTDVLRYLSGHSLLITSPVAEVNSAEARDNLSDVAFSVLDAETGKVLRNIPGPHLGGGGPKNNATDLAVSPDERFVVVICGPAEPQINVYSTDGWKQVATVDFRGGEKGGALDPRGLVFSPDGKTLAVMQGLNGRIKFFEAGSWVSAGSLLTYPEPSLPMQEVGAATLAYSPDGTMIAVGASRGGSWWTYPNGRVAWPGSGVFKATFPSDPLRVFRVSDGRLVASLGEFSGGLLRHGLVWSPNGNYLAFQDAVGVIRFWNPFQPNLSVAVARKGMILPPDEMLLSKDGSQLAADFTDGVKVFDVVLPR